jgi:hypothetical protein
MKKILQHQTLPILEIKNPAAQNSSREKKHTKLGQATDHMLTFIFQLSRLSNQDMNPL